MAQMLARLSYPMGKMGERLSYPLDKTLPVATMRRGARGGRPLIRPAFFGLTSVGSRIPYLYAFSKYISVFFQRSCL